MERLSIFMVGDEAPAATAAAQRIGWAVSKIERFSFDGPISLVAAEIHPEPEASTPLGCIATFKLCASAITQINRARSIDYRKRWVRGGARRQLPANSQA